MESGEPGLSALGQSRRITVSTKYLILVLLLIAALSPAHCWGPEGHSLITQHAIELLPSDIKPFYQANERYVVALCTLPDDWRESHKDTGPEHFYDLDELDQPPFTKARGTREEVERRFGKEKVLHAGLLPWTIEERFARLVRAFKEGDEAEVVVQSALLAHFVGDAHVPFHATMFYDGKKPEQKGLHFRWETNLIALNLKPESIKPTSTTKIQAVLPAAFDWCIASNSAVETILAADDRAREIDPGHGYRYFRSLAGDTMSILRSRLTSSAEDLAGVYVLAWEQAGKPKLSDKPAAILWGH